MSVIFAILRLMVLFLVVLVERNFQGFVLSSSCCNDPYPMDHRASRRAFYKLPSISIQIQELGGVHRLPGSTMIQNWT